LLNDPAVASMFKAANITAGWQHCDQSWVVHGACGKFLPVPTTNTTTTTLTTGNGTVLAQTNGIDGVLYNGHIYLTEEALDRKIHEYGHSWSNQTDWIIKLRQEMEGKEEAMRDAMAYGCSHITWAPVLSKQCGPKNLAQCNAENKSRIQDFTAMSASDLDAKIHQATIHQAKTLAENLETECREFLARILVLFNQGEMTAELGEQYQNKVTERDEAEDAHWEMRKTEEECRRCIRMQRPRDCNGCIRDQESCDMGMAQAVKAFADAKEIKKHIGKLNDDRVSLGFKKADPP